MSSQATKSGSKARAWPRRAVVEELNHPGPFDSKQREVRLSCGHVAFTHARRAVHCWQCAGEPGR